MPGVVESNELPEGGGGLTTTTTGAVVSDAPRRTAADVEDMADRLRFMGIEDPVILEFECRADEDYGAAATWLQAQLEALPRPPRWMCDCGEQLVDDDWRGQATLRCSECGTRWGLDSREDGGGSSQWSVSWPSEEWLAAHPPVVDNSYGDHPPEAVLESGLPPMVDGIEPDTAFPLAVWSDGSAAGVLYVYRQRLGEFDLPGEEYGHEIEHLWHDPAKGWTSGGSGGGGWVNPFSPPMALLEKYVVLGTGIAGTNDGDDDISLTGGLCSPAVAAVEFDEDGERSTIAVDPVRRTFLVGTRAGTAYVRFLDANGVALTDHRGEVVEFQLAGSRSGRTT